MSGHVLIDERRVGPDEPVLVIAEAGVNHNGDIDLARRLIDVAGDAGADAVKFQTFQVDRLVTASAPKADYQAINEPASENQANMLRHLQLSEADHFALQQHCSEKGIMFISTPFEEFSADFLESMNVPAFKIPSGEITNLPFLTHVAGKNRPIILSTGMASLDEVEVAVKAIEATGNKQLVILHCLSQYPADPAQANLRAMHTLAEAFGHPIGYSDHTPGVAISHAAVALGACVIEKHFTLDRTLPGPDHAASLEPDELTNLIDGIRAVGSAMGDGRKVRQPSEQSTADVARKSLLTARAMAAGETVRKEDLVIMRPGTGLAPDMMEMVVGRQFSHDVPAHHLITLDDLV